MSEIGWIDFSSRDRQRTQDVLASLSEPGTLDELGIGQIRDGFSDRLFPGFSTIQTSAKYFIALPSVFRDWEERFLRGQAKGRFEEYLRDQENTLAKKLSENHERLGISLQGVIGHTMVDKGGVARRPSSIYWNGMRILGLVRSNISLSEFCIQWQQPGTTGNGVSAEEGADDDSVRRNGLIRRPPGYAEGWMDVVTLPLTFAEAEFLKERIRLAVNQHDAASTQIVRHDLLSEISEKNIENFAMFQEWLSRKSTISDMCRETAYQAQQFSLAMEGAHIRFNLLLGKAIGSDRLQSYSEDAFTEWKSRAKVRNVFSDGAPEAWLHASGSTGIPARTRKFLGDWSEALLQGAPDDRLNAIVQRQAIENKPDRSVLLKPPKKEPDWVGMRSLEYRWGTVRQMFREIAEGLKC